MNSEKDQIINMAFNLIEDLFYILDYADFSNGVTHMGAGGMISNLRTTFKNLKKVKKKGG